MHTLDQDQHKEQEREFKGGILTKSFIDNFSMYNIREYRMKESTFWRHYLIDIHRFQFTKYSF